MRLIISANGQETENSSGWELIGTFRNRRNAKAALRREYANRNKR